MKASMNGVLNLSVLDGWWPEAYSPEIGWAIAGESDEADRAELYRLLEEEIVPTYFENRQRWLAMMKASIERVTPRFSSDRMVREYVERYYEPAARAAGAP
jgi:starch phosphorylase